MSLQLGKLLGFQRGCKAARINGERLPIPTCLGKRSASKMQLPGSELLWLMHGCM